MKSTNSLWLLFLEGDDKAFSALFKSYYSILHSYGNKIEGNDIFTEDCLQNLFVNLYENRARLSHIKNPNAYLFVSLRNAIRKKLAEANEKEELTNAIKEKMSFVFSVEDFLIQKESILSSSIALNEMINGLSNREREIIYLKYYSELSNTEISEVMNISPQSVSNTLLKAMTKLREGTLRDVLAKAISQ